MKKLIVFLCLGVFVHAKPSHHHPYNDVYPVHPGVGAIYKGPNSETIIEGPDGSVITSEADGGAVALKGDALVVPVAPVVNAVAPVVKQVGPPVVTSHHEVSSSTYEAKTVSHTPIVVEQPVVVPQAILVADTKDTASLEGPSGSIHTHGEHAVVSGPSSTTITDGKFVVSIPNVEVQTVNEAHLRPVESTLVIDNSHHQSVEVTPTVVVSTPAPGLYAHGGHEGQSHVQVTPQVVVSTPAPGLSAHASYPAHSHVQVAPQVVVSTPVPAVYAEEHSGHHGLVRNDVGVVHNEVYVSSSTPSPLGHAEVVSPAVSLSPPLVHSDSVYQAGLAHANEAAISAALANNARVEQSVLSAAQYAEYEKAVNAENERRAFEAHVAARNRHAGHGLVQHQELGPVISQGNQVISGHVVSSTAAPILVSSLSPVSSSVHNAHAIKELVSIGPQVFQDVVSSTVKPEILVTPTPIVSSTVYQDVGYAARVTPTENVIIASTPNEIVSHGPLISRPKAILAPVRAEVSPGQVLVQSNSVSERHESSHSSSSVEHSSSTGIISRPVAVDSHVLVDGRGPYGEGHGPYGPHGRPQAVGYGPHPGLSGISPSDLAQWQHSLVGRGYYDKHGRVRRPHGPRYYH